MCLFVAPSPPKKKYIKIVVATTAAAAGIGKPTKLFLLTRFTCTLKRASRSAPQITYSEAANQPHGPHGSNAHRYASTPGATPNAITSESESYSTPNWLEVLVNRAIRPSSASNTRATRMATAANK